MKQSIQLTNKEMRRLWVRAQGLAAAPTGALTQVGLLEIISQIGFVQLDTIRVIARAHDHILWSRNQNYRDPMLSDLLKSRDVFEHFTHDASVLPIDTYPYWSAQFNRMRNKLDSGYWSDYLPESNQRNKILARIKKEGPLSTRAFQSDDSRRKEGWARPPHKFALDYFWYAGILATCHRKNFEKFYDTREKVIPEDVRKNNIGKRQQIDWLCEKALARLGVANEGEIQRFWDAISLDDVKKWVCRSREKLISVEVVDAEGGPYNALALDELEEKISTLKASTTRLRIINPFDPLIRDRKRTWSIFGFDYRIEIFIPAKKREYGYYVYPMLEGDRLIGRIEAKAERLQDRIIVKNIWWETGITATANRKSKLEAELSRMARFIGVDAVDWECRV